MSLYANEFKLDADTGLNLSREQLSDVTPITDAERRKRQEAVNFARASAGLEGFIPSEQFEALAQRFINGEIELSEFVNSNAETVLPTDGATD